MALLFVVGASASTTLDPYYTNTANYGDWNAIIGQNWTSSAETVGTQVVNPVDGSAVEYDVGYRGGSTVPSVTPTQADTLTAIEETGAAEGLTEGTAALLPTITLAATAFAGGYEIGRAIDRTFLGIDAPALPFFHTGGGTSGSDTATVTTEALALVTNTGGSPSEYNCELFNSASPQFGSGGNVSVEGNIRNANGSVSTGCYIMTFSGTSPQCGNWSQWWYGTASAGDGPCVLAENTAVNNAAAALVSGGTALYQDTFSGLTCQSDADGCHELVAPATINTPSALAPPFQVITIKPYNSSTDSLTTASGSPTSPAPNYTPPTIANSTVPAAQTACQNDGNCAQYANHKHSPSTYPSDPLSTAPPVTTYTVPDCTGMSVSSCESALSAAGSTGTVTPANVDYPYGAIITQPAGAVVTQNPAGGAVVTFSTAVELDTNPSTLPIEVLMPKIGEAYPDYIARLQSQGYLGTSVRVDLSDDTADTTLGPSAVARITIPTYSPSTGVQVGTRILTPSTWPANPTPLPRITPGDAITVEVNPADIPAPANSGEPWDQPDGTPTNAPVGAPASTCPVISQTLDTSPLTGLNFGSKFPFGLWTWLQTVVGYFNVTPVAPSITISLNSIINPIITPFGVNPVNVSGTVDLAPFDSYMSDVRTIIAFALWIGAVWYIAVSFLGFRAGGDLSEAADDGLAL